jgi:hypothetical protein
MNPIQLNTRYSYAIYAFSRQQVSTSVSPLPAKPSLNLHFSPQPGMSGSPLTPQPKTMVFRYRLER